jgi:hypothetical protein
MTSQAAGGLTIIAPTLFLVCSPSSSSNHFLLSNDRGEGAACWESSKLLNQAQATWLPVCMFVIASAPQPEDKQTEIIPPALANINEVHSGPHSCSSLASLWFANWLNPRPGNPLRHGHPNHSRRFARFQVSC